MSVTDRLLNAIALRLAVLVLMCLAARLLPISAPDAFRSNALKVAVVQTGLHLGGDGKTRR